MLATGDLLIAGQTVPGEGAQARAVQELLPTGAPGRRLLRAGVGWLVDEHDSSGARGASARSVDGLPIAYRDGDIALYQVGAAIWLRLKISGRRWCRSPDLGGGADLGAIIALGT